MSGIRVLVVDDDALVRSGLVMILGGAPDIVVAGRPPTAMRRWAWSVRRHPTWC
ncbi:MAG: hypothetical protein WKF78_00300 [Candidatus Limnocylindrales bacterium]